MNLKLSDFLKLKITPFLYGTFLSRIMEESKDGKKYFYAYSYFKTSKYVYECDFPFKSYASTLLDKMNWFSGHKNWIVFKATDSYMDLRFYLENDLNITKTQFYKLLYQMLMSCEWVYETGINEEKAVFIRGFCETRGSVDTSRKLIAQDYYYNNRLELKKALLLTDTMEIPYDYANFNARELQPQYVSGKSKRNTQFRINSYFYAKNIGFINDYKARVFSNAFKQKVMHIENKITYFDLDVPKCNSDTTFVQYLNFFTNNIYEKNLTPAAIKELRAKLSFDELNDETPNKNRNYSIIELYREISEDKCAICGTTHTYENKRTGRQHFEIHHVISFSNGKECDNIANLVKLCPTCHDMLKKNATSKETQIKAIEKILHRNNVALEFASSYFATEDFDEICDLVHQHLG